MGSKAKKSTKKFEKRHLKDTIDRRKEFAKIKQRQQIKAKKQARHASDHAKADDIDEGGKEKNSTRQKVDNTDNFKDMTVDEFFQSGFDVPELKGKFKKTANTVSQLGEEEIGGDSDGGLDQEFGSNSNVAVEQDIEDSDGEGGSEADEDMAMHKQDLDALADKDPEFYEYLKENDAELLDFEEDAHLVLSEEEDQPTNKRKRPEETEDLIEESAGVEVTMSTVKKWKTALTEQHSLRAMRQVILAFRAAAYINEEEGKEFKYSIPNPEVYHEVLVNALQYVPSVLNHHLPVKESTSGKVNVATESKKFRTLSPLLKSYVVSLTHLLENLFDAPTINLTLSSVQPLLPYVLSFKKALKTLVGVIVDIWSGPSSTEATRVNAFLLIRRLAVIGDNSIREAILKSTYQGLVKGSRNTTTHTLAGINLMKNSAAELWGINPSIGYTTGFTYIRQLAIHLRSSITQPTKDSYKAIYNWQYTHSLDFWSRVLSIHCSPATNTTLKSPQSSPLHPLIYPLVQITLGALRLIPTPTYFPLRFHLTRSLLRISRSTNTYIPLAPSLLEVLQSPEIKKAPKPSTLRPLDFNTSIRAPKSYLKTRVYQDGCGEQVSELLAEFFGVWCKNIAFPELTIPPSVLLKRWLKEVSPKSKQAHDSGKKSKKGNQNSKLSNSISLLLQKLSANAQFVEEKRRKVDFAPSDRAQVEMFLKDVKWEDMPLGAYVEGLRKRKEERERTEEEGRRAQEERKKIGGKDEMEVDGISDEDSDMDEEED